MSLILCGEYVYNHCFLYLASPIYSGKQSKPKMPPCMMSTCHVFLHQPICKLIHVNGNIIGNYIVTDIDSFDDKVFGR